MGSDPKFPSPPPAKPEFQFALPHGERHDAGGVVRPDKRFNSRSRMGSDLGAMTCCRRESVFQFALPHGERPRAPAHTDVQSGFQFALPHGERPVMAKTPHIAKQFQFALPHGERPRPPAAAMRKPCFNSRSRMGSDSPRIFCGWTLRSFNSRSRMGSDLHFSRTPPASLEFQFALPHGERPPRPHRSLAQFEFQFALPHGERLLRVQPHRAVVVVSIRAPAWGATAIMQ